MLEIIALAIQKLILALSYPGIFLLMMADALNIPAASEITMSFSGFLAQRGDLIFWFALIAGIIGNITGASINWFLGYKGRELFVRREEIVKGEKILKSWGMLALFIGNITPFVRSFIAFPAGLIRIPYWKFIVSSVPAYIIWNFTFVSLGYNLGQNWQKIEPIFRKYEYAVIGFLIAAIIFFIWHRWLHKNGNSLSKINQSKEAAKEEHKRKILALFTYQDKITNNDVEKLLNVSDATAKRYLQELERENNIAQQGTDGRGVYYIKKN